MSPERNNSFSISNVHWNSALTLMIARMDADLLRLPSQSLLHSAWLYNKNRSVGRNAMIALLSESPVPLRLPNLLLCWFCLHLSFSDLVIKISIFFIDSFICRKQVSSFQTGSILPCCPRLFIHRCVSKKKNYLRLQGTCYQFVILVRLESYCYVS